MKLLKLVCLSSLFCLNTHCAENAHSKKAQKLICLNRQLRCVVRQKQLLFARKAQLNPALKSESDEINQIRNVIKELVKCIDELELKIANLQNADA